MLAKNTAVQKYSLTDLLAWLQSIIIIGLCLKRSIARVL